MSNKIDDALNFDPLEKAQEITGRSYVGDKETMGIGLMLAHENADEKEKLLKEAGDVHNRMLLKEYIQVITAYGFELALELPFDSVATGREEFMYVFCHIEKGLILRFDTWSWSASEEKTVNGGSLLYNVHVKKDHVDGDYRLYSYTSSGHLNVDDDSGDCVWVGYVDCREGLLRHIERFEEVGHFLPVWKENPFLWFLHHGDTKDEEYDYKAINAERIPQLSDAAQKIILLETQ